MSNREHVLLIVVVLGCLVMLVMAIAHDPPPRPYPGFNDWRSNGQHVDGDYIGNWRVP
jgi:hypothetical protein